jgi:hypothetical protein
MQILRLQDIFVKLTLFSSCRRIPKPSSYCRTVGKYMSSVLSFGFGLPSGVQKIFHVCFYLFFLTHARARAVITNDVSNYINLLIRK